MTITPPPPRLKHKGRSGLAVTALAAAVSLAMLPEQAAAQTAGARAVEEIVVTARRIDETLIDAPITVNVMTASQLEDAGVTETKDWVQMIPNVSLAESQTQGTSFLTVRGLSRVRNGELPVAVVVDDVLIVNARQFTGQVFDVQQIEFVKGPQGAYYGRNASNGAVVVTTKPPGDEPEGYIKTSFGSAHELAVEGSFSTPLTDRIGLRLSARSVERDGYFDSATLNDEVDPLSDRTLRARLTYERSPDLSFDFKAEVAQHEGKGIGFHWPGIAIFGVEDVLTELGVTLDQVTGEGANLTGLPYVANNPDRGTRETSNFSFKVDRAFANTDFRSVTTYNTLTTSSVADRAPYLSYLDGTQHSYADVHGFSQEFRLTSDTDSRLSWQVGAYYLAWERVRTTVSGVDRGLGIRPATTVPEFEDSTNPTGRHTGMVAPNDVELDPAAFLSFLEDSNNMAFFGSINYELSDRWYVSIAARHDDETREQNVNPYNTAGRLYAMADSDGVNHAYAGADCEEGDTVNVNCGIYNTFTDLLANTHPRAEKNEENFSKLQPKFTVSFTPRDGVNIYANWGIGFRAGQFNYPGIGSISNTAKEVIDQEENSSFEIGVKRETGNFRFNAAYFSSQVENTQYFPFDGLAFVQVFEDVDEAELSGFELEGLWTPNEQWTLYAAYGATDAEITGYEERPMTEGNDLPYVPESTLNLGAHYVWPVSLGVTGFFRVDYEVRGEQYWTPENSYPRDELSLLNIRFGLEGDRWSSSVYVNNATDEEYNSEVVTPLFLHPAPPRIWRWDVRYNF